MKAHSRMDEIFWLSDRMVESVRAYNGLDMFAAALLTARRLALGCHLARHELGLPRPATERKGRRLSRLPGGQAE
jgi:hypothetical protein